MLYSKGKRIDAGASREEHSNLPVVTTVYVSPEESKLFLLDRGEVAAIAAIDNDFDRALAIRERATEVIDDLRGSERFRVAGYC